MFSHMVHHHRHHEVVLVVAPRQMVDLLHLHQAVLVVEVVWVQR